MAQFFAEYGLFLLKVVTIVAGIVVILIMAMRKRSKSTI